MYRFKEMKPTGYYFSWYSLCILYKQKFETSLEVMTTKFNDHLNDIYVIPIIQVRLEACIYF